MDKKSNNGTMSSWAENEIKLACKKEKELAERPEDATYGCTVYESAFRAFKSLAKDGHSGFSIHQAKHILVRLIDGKPLTPIEDTDDIWEDITHMCDLDTGVLKYQCKRMFSLFKRVMPDGTVTYRDVDRCYGVEEGDDDGATFNTGLLSDIANEMWPITMPYCPGEPVKFVTNTCLVDRKNGDYDTRAVLYAVKDDERILINRYFKYTDAGFVEIDEQEHWERVMRASQRIHDELEEGTIRGKKSEGAMSNE